MDLTIEGPSGWATSAWRRQGIGDAVTGYLDSAGGQGTFAKRIEEAAFPVWQAKLEAVRR